MVIAIAFLLLISLVFSSLISGFAGQLGALLLIRVYCSSIIFFFGAEFAQV